MHEPYLPDVRMWSHLAMQREAMALVNAGHWDRAARLARESQHLRSQSTDASYFTVTRAVLSAASDEPCENVALHVCTGLRETAAGGLQVPGWRADPGHLDHYRRRIFVHDGQQGLAYTPSYHAGQFGQCVDLTHVWATNWFHFLLETLSRLANPGSAPPGARILINRAVTQGPYLEALKALAGDHLHRMVPTGFWARLTCDELHPLRSCWTASFYHADPARTDHREACLHNPDAATAFFRRAWPRRAALGDRIVLPRPAESRPRCENEAELVAAARAAGFAAVSPETLPFSAQVAAFYDADVILAASGAALANLVFCRPGTRVIVLRDAESDSPTFGSLAAGLGLDFHAVDCAQTCPGPQRDYSRFRADITALAPLLR